MCTVVSVFITVHEALVACCALPALFDLREVTEDGSVLT
jgi:predicted acylesterase/phospholipase RssA